MLTDAHVEEGGVKNGQKYAHVVYGRPLLVILIYCYALVLNTHLKNFFDVVKLPSASSHKNASFFRHFIEIFSEFGIEFSPQNFSAKHCIQRMVGFNHSFLSCRIQKLEG